MSYLISNYVAEIRANIAFDQKNAHRLAEEAEDHLYEAMAHDVRGPCCEAAQGAIDRFGSATDVATDFTLQMFPERLKTTWRDGLLIGALILFAMWLRRELDLMPLLLKLPSSDLLIAADSIGLKFALATGFMAWVVWATKLLRLRPVWVVAVLGVAAIALALSVGASLIIALYAVSISAGSLHSLVSFGMTLLVSGLLCALMARVRVLYGYAGFLSQIGYQA